MGYYRQVKEKKEMKTNTESSTFANKPILVITVEGESKAIISFGLKKAKAILASVEEIKKFVEENEK